MKRLLSVCFTGMMVLCVVGCSNTYTAPNTSESENTYQDEVPQQENIPESLDDYQVSEPFFSVSGSGDDVVTGLYTEYVSFLKVTHSGDGHFAVKAHYGDDSDYDLLINTTEPYNGGQTLLFSGREYTLEITSKGDWSVEAYQIGTSSTDSFSGAGDIVTPIFIPTSEVYEIEAEGAGHFAVKGWSATTGRYDLLVNTTDSYSGAVMFNHPEEYCFFEITGERNFTITPRK